MKSKLIAVGMAAALAVGSIGIASATSIDLITNGDFSQTNNGTTTNTQFGSQSAYGFTSHQFITNWTGNDGYEIWFSSPGDATSVDAHSIWGQGSTHDTGNEMLWDVTAPPNGTQTFVGLDGDQVKEGANQVQSSIGQWLNNLTVGQTYEVSFDWGAAQLKSRNGATKTNLAIYAGTSTDPFDSLLHTTKVLDNPSHGFTGWESTSFSFVADSTSTFLNFLSVGTPSGLPPMALLSNVSAHAVPEPSELGLFGLGLFGLGLLTIAARRRALHRRDAADGNDTVA